jgi:hypothetical protein
MNVTAAPTQRLSRSGRIDGLLAIGGAVALAATLGLTRLAATDVADALIRNTVRLSLTWYAAALFMMMRMQRDDWAVRTRFGQITRWCWTWGVIVFLVHLSMAFHYFHGWSHAHAFETTRQASGVGEGVFFSYFFTLWWTLDAAVWWAAPRWYADRPAWIGRTLHLLMLFIVFNGMVVFESGPIRWAGIVLFIALPAAWLLSRRPRLDHAV